MRIDYRHIISIVLLVMLSSAVPVYSQVDTVCASSPFGRYGVIGSSGSMFIWDVNGGQIIQSNGADSIEVQWDFSQSQFSLSVVEINQSGCVGDTISAIVTKGSDPSLLILGSDSLCINSNASLFAQGASSYLWSTGDTTAFIEPFITEDSVIVLYGTNGCGYDTLDFYLTAVAKPTIDFTVQPDELVENETAIFTYTGQGATHFNWYIDQIPTNADYAIYNHRFLQDGNYYITLWAANDLQCADTLSKMILVHQSRTNSFTPNGDGVNDTWRVVELENYPDCKMWIYDRNGMEVFYSLGYQASWDGTFKGKELPQGSYFYVIDYGTKDKTSKGIIVILR